MSRVCRRASPEANTVGPLLCTLGSLIFLQRSALFAESDCLLHSDSEMSPSHCRFCRMMSSGLEELLAQSLA